MKVSRSFPTKLHPGTTAEKCGPGMHRISDTKVWSAVLPLLAAAWVLAAYSASANAGEEAQGSATRIPAAQANSSGFDPYLSAGVALMRKEDTRFVDDRDSGHAALYGNENTFDAGEVDNGLQFHLAAGTRLPYRLRAQLELGLTRDLKWRGNANYQNSGEHQPSRARLETHQFLLAGFRDFRGWELAQGRRIQPFLGAGLGYTDYRLRRYVQRFPEPDNPQGYLRRGPGGEIPSTALPRGSGQNFTWMLTAGLAIPIHSNIHLDLSYRYTDAGEIRTRTGDITVVRYREDGTRREIVVPINRTTADYRTRSLLAVLRFRF